MSSTRASRSIEWTSREEAVIAVLAGLGAEQAPGRGADSSPNTECVPGCLAEQQRAPHRL